MFGPGGVEVPLRPARDPAAVARAASRLGADGARVFGTVSPIALDRHPGALFADVRAVRQAAQGATVAEVQRGHERAARAWAEASAVVREGLSRQGLPEPVDIELWPSCPFDAHEDAIAWAPFPRDPSRQQRVLVHAVLRFAEPVAGPLLLGAGRFLGLGLLLPMPSRP